MNITIEDNVLKRKVEEALRESGINCQEIIDNKEVTHLIVVIDSGISYSKIHQFTALLAEKNLRSTSNFFPDMQIIHIVVFD
ncbi:hypothetical protein [Emticicia sp. 17c]|uniref:hypothetical protein n=1 Tax=Emticicia sp. 17c TaxID=3127704 RepID=UPI00301CFBB5